MRFPRLACHEKTKTIKLRQILFSIGHSRKPSFGKNSAQSTRERRIDKQRMECWINGVLEKEKSITHYSAPRSPPAHGTRHHRNPSNRRATSSALARLLKAEMRK